MNEDLIKNDTVFAFTPGRGYDQKLQAGRYLLKTSMNMEEIMQTLQQGVLWEEDCDLPFPKVLR